MNQLRNLVLKAGDTNSTLGERHQAFSELVRLSDAALQHCPGSALLHFNRGVALDHLDRLDEAVASYERALELDETLADAHFNLARLRQEAGDERAALRHFNAYRRLQR